MVETSEEKKAMGLPPLEYLECYLDSPTFRENIAIYEKELKSNSEGLKALLKECQRMIQATEGRYTYIDTISCMYVEICTNEI